MSTDPTAPPASTAGHPLRNDPSIQCTRCGRPLSQGEILYSGEGSVICAACNSVAEIGESEGRAAGAVRSAAYASVITGLVGMCFNPFFLMTVITLTSSLGALVALLRDPLYKQRLGGQYGLVLAASIVGTLLGLVWVLLLVTGLSAAILGSRGR